MATTNQQLSIGRTREIPRSFFPSALLFPVIASHWQNPIERESKEAWLMYSMKVSFLRDRLEWRIVDRISGGTNEDYLGGVREGLF